MTRPVIGIIGNAQVIHDDYHTHAVGIMNSEAIAQVSGCLPMIVPTDPALVTTAELMTVCDGFLFTGGRANVHPEEYGEVETDAHGTFDRDRDAVALPLVRACVAAGMPILGVCRGFQEVAVAMGATLYPEIRDLPGRDNHRMPPDGTLEEKFALRHDVAFTKGGRFHQVMGAQTVRTNTLHGQGIKDAGSRLVVDGFAPDGTPEAIYVADAAGFTMSVQWHPEWRAGQDPVSQPLFKAFGDAARAWVTRQSQPIARSA